MQSWKIGLLIPPAIAGVAFGAKHIVQANSENETMSKDDVVAPPSPNTLIHKPHSIQILNRQNPT